jgi:restriction system protein
MTSKTYRRIMLGAKSAYAKECHEGGFVGAHWGFEDNLDGQFGEDWRDFNERYRPVYLANNPGKSKVAAGLACGMLFTICKGMQVGDIILSPDGNRNYLVGECVGPYYFAAGQILPQRRPVKWYEKRIPIDEMSIGLRNSMGSTGTVADVTKHAEEIARLIGSEAPPTVMATSAVIEDANTFALEKHLEDFLVANWSQTLLGRDYDIFSDEGELVGQQYPSDTGPIDVLAISKDRKTLLVVELKRGRASDVVVGQVQRYMGYVAGELAEEGQCVRGAIIALEDDLRLQRALSVTRNIDFYRYQVSFRLVQA